jgi:hypothetical protein
LQLVAEQIRPLARALSRKLPRRGERSLALESMNLADLAPDLGEVPRRDPFASDVVVVRLTARRDRIPEAF